MRYNVNYVLKIDSNDLYAYVKEINIILHFNNIEWVQVNLNLDDFLLLDFLEDIPYNQALSRTYGLPAHKVFKALGYETYDEDDVPNIDEILDSIKKFVVARREFAKFDYYKMEHNKEQSLKYSARELDSHYNLKIFDFLSEHYFEFLNRKLKNEFDYIIIYPINNDYIIEFDQTILL